MAAPASQSSSSAATALLKEGTLQGQRLLGFINQTGSPYHSVQAIKSCLAQSRRGFTELKESQLDQLRPGGAYYVTRNNACIAAFVVGERPSQQMSPRKDRFLIIATHTDSPCLRLRPNCNIMTEGTNQVGVECYGGGLWHTWFDRGLGLAGAVYVKEKGKVTAKFVRIARPLLFIPSLAIHLRSAEELSAGLKISKEKELQPVLCTEVYEQLQRLSASDSLQQHSSSSTAAAAVSEAPKDDREEDETKTAGAKDKRKRETGEEEDAAAAQLLHPRLNMRKMMPERLLQLLAKELKMEPDAILSWDLCLMDATPGRLCGIYEEFVESPRLDNLVSTFSAFDVLSSCQVPPHTVAVAIGFDHEEVGSSSYSGADSCLAKTWLNLIADGLGIKDFQQMLIRSFLLSADMAHAVHPNYVDRHQAQHKPSLQRGMVLKENANQRYATNAHGTAMLRALAEKNEVPLQDFVVKNDSRCGSTVGPFLSAQLGVCTIDVGVPQWAMHSCREICGTLDLVAAAKLFKAYYETFP